MSGRWGRRGALLISALLALAILLGLGFWQLDRRRTKAELLARLQHSLSLPPAAYTPPPAASTGGPAEREFRPVTVRGRFLPAWTWKEPTPTPEKAKRMTSERFGYRLFTPLAMEGAIVVVDRGFVPASLLAETEARFAREEGLATVTGAIRLARTAGLFLPSPSEKTREFVSPDIGAMAADFQKTNSSAPFVTSEYIEQTPAATPGWPLGRDAHELIAGIPNRHLEYALTWFGLAAALVGVILVYFLRPADPEPDRAGL